MQISYYLKILRLLHRGNVHSQCLCTGGFPNCTRWRLTSDLFRCHENEKSSLKRAQALLLASRWEWKRSSSVRSCTILELRHHRVGRGERKKRPRTHRGFKGILRNQQVFPINVRFSFLFSFLRRRGAVKQATHGLSFIAGIKPV